MKNSKIITVLANNDIYNQFLNGWQEAEFPSVCWLNNENRHYTPSQLGKADIIITRKDLSPKEYFQAKNLKLIQIPIAGYEQFQLPLAKKQNIHICNNGGANAPSVAEHALLLMLALQRQFIYHWQHATKYPWENKKYQNLELMGKKLGIIGLGNCGKELAIRAQAFGMNLFYFDIFKASSGFLKKWKISFLPLNQLLSQCDIISLHVPLTTHTRHLLNSEKLSLLKPSAFLINTARGEVIDEYALLQLLRDRKISGAGLDVFEKEPLPEDSPLRQLKNVILTPHCAPSYESTLRLKNNIANNIRKIIDGKKPDFIVKDYENLTPQQIKLLHEPL